MRMFKPVFSALACMALVAYMALPAGASVLLQPSGIDMVSASENNTESKLAAFIVADELVDVRAPSAFNHAGPLKQATTRQAKHGTSERSHVSLVPPDRQPRYYMRI